MQGCPKGELGFRATQCAAFDPAWKPYVDKGNFFIWDMMVEVFFQQRYKFINYRFLCLIFFCSVPVHTILHSGQFDCWGCCFCAWWNSLQPFIKWHLYWRKMQGDFWKKIALENNMLCVNCLLNNEFLLKMQRVGCDWRIDSTAEDDACGVCDGDGSQCVTHSNIFTKKEGKGETCLINLQ